MSTADKPMYEWSALPWKTIQRRVFKLQKRNYQASQRGDAKTVHRPQKPLTKSWSAPVLPRLPSRARLPHGAPRAAPARHADVDHRGGHRELLRPDRPRGGADLAAEARRGRAAGRARPRVPQGRVPRGVALARHLERDPAGLGDLALTRQRRAARPRGGGPRPVPATAEGSPDLEAGADPVRGRLRGPAREPGGYRRGEAAHQRLDGEYGTGAETEQDPHHPHLPLPRRQPRLRLPRLARAAVPCGEDALGQARKRSVRHGPARLQDPDPAQQGRPTQALRADLRDRRPPHRGTAGRPHRPPQSDGPAVGAVPLGGQLGARLQQDAPSDLREAPALGTAPSPQEER